jgi:diguanylate cyclase (GGDEF)-like protein
MFENSHAEIRQIFIKYLDTYFVERNIKSSLAIFSPDVTGFGTGADEVARDLNDFLDLYSRDLSEATNPIYYQISNLDINTYPGLGIVSCQLNIQTEILDQKLKFNKLRLSMVFTLLGGEWQVAHMHISLPTQTHADDESYPLKELEDRNKVLRRLVDERTEKLFTTIKEISVLASTDKLTGVFNRLKIDECLNLELQRSARYGNKLCVIMIDIDHFKRINDNYGHLIGDQVLIEFVNLISSRIRKTDIIGRWGGEEFFIICPETELESAVQMAETIRFMIEAKEIKQSESITASFGVSSYLANDTYATIISRADTALYEAKKTGRNRVIAQSDQVVKCSI